MTTMCFDTMCFDTLRFDTNYVRSPRRSIKCSLPYQHCIDIMRFLYNALDAMHQGSMFSCVSF